MRVLSILHQPTFAGPHNQVMRLSEPLARRGMSSVALLPLEPGNAASRLRGAGVDVITMPLHRLRMRKDPRVHARLVASFPTEIRALQSVIRQRAIDVVLVNSLYNPHGAVAARLEGIAVVWQIIDTVAPPFVRRLMMPAVTRLSDIVMTTGVAVAQSHPGALEMGGRFVPFAPPVDTIALRPDPVRRAAARKELAVPEDATVVGMVGNLNPTKGHEFIVRAVAGLRSGYPNVHLRLLASSTPGHEEYERSVRQAVRASGLGDDQVLVRDPGSRVGELLPGLDILALTSVPRSEGLPTVILEAMACGLPVLATNVGSVGEVVEDGVTGFLVDALDQYGIMAALGRLVEDEPARHRMGAVARERATSAYDVEICASLHADVFKRAVALAEQRGRCKRRLRTGAA